MKNYIKMLNTKMNELKDNYNYDMQRYLMIESIACC